MVADYALAGRAVVQTRSSAEVGMDVTGVCDWDLAVPLWEAEACCTRGGMEQARDLDGSS